jgi:hypothetical protein
MRKNDYVTGVQLGALSIQQLDDGPAVDNQVVEHKVLRPQTGSGRHRFCRGRQKSPRRRKFGMEEHSAVQLDSTQDLRERVHFDSLAYLQTSPVFG